VCSFAGPADAVAACVISARARAAVMRPNVDQSVGKVAEWERGSATPAASRLLLAGGSWQWHGSTYETLSQVGAEARGANHIHV
jgi:hypothetical protein